MSTFRSMFRMGIALTILLLLPSLFVPSTAAQAPAPHRLVQGTLTDFLPDWVKEGGPSAMLNRIADPELRTQIETEINAIVAAKVGGPEDILLTLSGETVEDWMRAFDRETNFDYLLEPGQALFSFVNLDYNIGNTLYVDEFTVYDLETGEVAFHYDFVGNDGDPWSAEAFGPNLFAAPRNPDAVRYFILDNVGIMDVDPRRQGSASSYGKLTPVMDDLRSSEVLMRFRVDVTGLTQYLRVWIQSDQFGSGSSFAVNGYGIALHLGRDELTLQRRESSTTIALDTVPANMTTDWHWLRLRAADGKVSVKLWNDHDEEPAAWDIEYDLVEVEKKAALSFANLDADKENTLYIDQIVVSAPPFEDNVVFTYDFAGNDGGPWDGEAFPLMYAHGVSYTIQDNVGVVTLGKRLDPLNAAYGKVVPNMGNLMDSQLLMRFRVDNVGDDQWIRAFVRADEFQEGNSKPRNGFGVQLSLKDRALTMFKMENQVTYHLGRADVDFTADWHWLRLSLVGDELAVRLWKDGEMEPDAWTLARRVPEHVSAGEAIMRLLVIRGDVDVLYPVVEG